MFYISNAYHCNLQQINFQYIVKNISPSLNQLLQYGTVKKVLLIQI